MFAGISANFKLKCNQGTAVAAVKPFVSERIAVVASRGRTMSIGSRIAKTVCSKVQVHREKFLLTHIFLSQSKHMNGNKGKKKKKRKKEKLQSARDRNLHLFVKLLEVPWEFSFSVKFIRRNKKRKR